jgi:hypothetical protein
MSLGGGGVSLEREQARIDALRKRNEARVGRFLNVRERSIGMDCEALDKQVLEKQVQRQREEKAEKEAAAHREEVLRAMAERDEREKECRRWEADRLRAEWLQAAREQEDRKKREKQDRLAGNDEQRSGASALLHMSGHDPHKAERVRAQQAQMRHWSEEQESERQRRQAEERNEAQEYAQYLQEVTSMRKAAETAKAEMRRALELETAQRNKELVEQRLRASAALKQEETLADKREIEARDAALRETKGRVCNPETGKLMRDRYKGMRKEEVEELMMENERLHKEKTDRQDAERLKEMEWSVQRETVKRLVDTREQELQRLRLEEQARVREELLEQRSRFAQNKFLAHVDRFGDIDASEGVYAGFGRSCR